MAWSNRTRAASAFANRIIQSGITLVGNLSELDFIAMLGFAPEESTPIPGTGGKTFGQLKITDTIRAPIFRNRSANSTDWANRIRN